MDINFIRFLVRSQSSPGILKSDYRTLAKTRILTLSRVQVQYGDYHSSRRNRIMPICPPSDAFTSTNVQDQIHLNFKYLSVSQCYKSRKYIF